MLVRDHTKKKSEYKGRECVVSDKFCPCRPCYNCHDCGCRLSSGKWMERMMCATNMTGGCPYVDDHLPVPLHIFKNTRRFQKRKVHDKFRCLRCNQVIELGEERFTNDCKLDYSKIFNFKLEDKNHE